MSCTIQPLTDRHLSYLSDESRMAGQAESISFPTSEVEVQQIVSTLSRQQTPMTVQGSRTGVTGGAVPAGGHILNLSALNNIIGLCQDEAGAFSIRVQPGLTLAELNRQLYHGHFAASDWDKNALAALAAYQRSGRHFWPPDPTEKLASIGGMAANNARGICAHHYGPASRYISQIRIADANGDIHTLARGQDRFAPAISPRSGGAEADVTGPGAAIDLFDLFLGSEGVLGVITELTLSLRPLPPEMWGIAFFFRDQSPAAAFIEAVCQRPAQAPEAALVSLEFMDQTTLACMRRFRPTNSRPALPADIFNTLVYTEIHGRGIEPVEALAQWFMEVATACDGDPDATWAFAGIDELERFHLFRHAAPESVNTVIDEARQGDPRITKLGTDMRPGGASFAETLKMYQMDLHRSGLNAAIFGHAAEAHLHVNILPQNYTQYRAGLELTRRWAAEIRTKGGSVVTEHGVGKLKKQLFKPGELPPRLAAIRQLKQQLDPAGLWNPGTMLD